MKKKLTRYSDDLDSKEKAKIEKFGLPWQRKFLFNFYKQLKKQELSKTDICDKLRNNPRKDFLLPNGYDLPLNTLTQFTNFNSSDMRTVSVSNLIAVSLALGVSINYLLGIDSCETPENTDINKATGLENETIEIIKSNKGLQEKLDFFLSSSELNKVCEEIDQLFITRLIFNDILSAYSEELFRKIENAYKIFFSETFALDRTEEKYRDYLYQELPFEKMKSNNTADSIMDYLKSNLSSDHITQIQLQLEECNNDEHNIYHIFINMTANFTYDIFEKQYTEEMRKNRISQSVIMLIDNYIQEKIKTTHDTIKNNIQRHYYKAK